MCLESILNDFSIAPETWDIIKLVFTPSQLEILPEKHFPHLSDRPAIQAPGALRNRRNSVTVPIHIKQFGFRIGVCSRGWIAGPIPLSRHYSASRKRHCASAMSPICPWWSTDPAWMKRVPQRPSSVSIAKRTMQCVTRFPSCISSMVPKACSSAARGA